MTSVTRGCDVCHISPSTFVFSRAERLLALDKPGDSFSEDVRRREQAKYKIIVVAKIVEMARMNENMVCPQEFDGEVLIGEAGREPQHRVPPAIRIEQFPGRILRHNRLQVPAIFPQTSQNLWLQRATLLQ